MGIKDLGCRVYGVGFAAMVEIAPGRLLRPWEVIRRPGTGASSPRDQHGLGFTWTPKVCKIMALMAIIKGFELSFYILLGFR